MQYGLINILKNIPSLKLVRIIHYMDCLWFVLSFLFIGINSITGNIFSLLLILLNKPLIFRAKMEKNIHPINDAIFYSFIASGLQIIYFYKTDTIGLNLNFVLDIGDSLFLILTINSLFIIRKYFLLNLKYIQ